jgi:hypothetical protein
MMKTCSKCGLEKNESCFSKRRNGLRSDCKECVKIASTIYYSKNKNVINERNRKYWAENKETLNEWQKQYFSEHKEERHQYYVDNKESIYANKRLYENNRLQTDATFKIRKNVSHAIRRFMKKLGGSKRGLSISKYLPYTIQELRKHLEKQFEFWMNWENYGNYNPDNWDDNDPSTWTWQIDHIVPHSTFNYISLEDQDFKKCWALSNLRPLSAKQNLSDGLTRIRHRK